MECIRTDTPPALTDKDKVIRKDAATYQQLKSEAEALTVRLDQAKEALVQLASHPSESGFGVSVTQYWKQGNVDYKRVPELQGVSLDAYRGKGKTEVRVSVGK